MTSTPKTIKAAELQLGDVVTPTYRQISPWDACIVEKVTPTQVTLFRPYGTCSDFSCSGGEPDSHSVICYTGIEEYTVFRDSSTEFYLWERKALK
jgi:hypothetical protein